MNPSCLICGQPTCEHGRAKVRQRHTGLFRRCSRCGFVFIEDVLWLAEAYAEPINVSDTGYVARNLLCRVRARMFIELFLNPEGKFLDYAAGYGMFVRLMRDLGYDFRWTDAYCQNLFARSFEEPEPLRGPFEAVTAFEVFEHLLDPVQQMAKLSSVTQCVIFTTSLLPNPAPAPDDWWYYGLEHGQHVSFYTLESLRTLAARFGYQLISNGSAFHAFTRRPLSLNRFRRIDDRWWQWWIARTRQRPSRTWSDHEEVKNRYLKANEQPG